MLFLNDQQKSCKIKITMNSFCGQVGYRASVLRVGPASAGSALTPSEHVSNTKSQPRPLTRNFGGRLQPSLH